MYKILIIFLFLTGCMGSGDQDVSFRGNPPQCIKGDINFDGVINRTDFDMLARVNMSRTSVNMRDGSCIVWDLDNDGDLTDNDVLILNSFL